MKKGATHPLLLLIFIQGKQILKEWPKATSVHGDRAGARPLEKCRLESSQQLLTFVTLPLKQLSIMYILP